MVRQARQVRRISRSQIHSKVEDFQDETTEAIKADSKTTAIKSLSIKLNIKTRQIPITLSKGLSIINKRPPKSIKASSSLKALTMTIKEIANIRRPMLTSSASTLLAATAIHPSTQSLSYISTYEKIAYQRLQAQLTS